MPKFILTEECRLVKSVGRTPVYLRRIKAMEDFINIKGEVKAGELGGFVLSENSIDVESNAWVYDDAQVLSKYPITGNVAVCDEAQVSGNARVSGNCIIKGNSTVCNCSSLDGDCEISGYAKIRDRARLNGRVIVTDYAHIGDHININARSSIISGYAKLVGRGCINGTNVNIGDSAVIKDKVSIIGNNCFISNVILGGNFEIHSDAKILMHHDYIEINCNDFHVIGYRLNNNPDKIRIVLNGNEDYNIEEFRKICIKNGNEHPISLITSYLY